MAVYVDDMRASYGQMLMCHMVADSDQELHAMADEIGIKRRWFQGDHYDIPLKIRRAALSLGAVEIPWMQCAAMIYVRRYSGFFCAPGEAWKKAREVRNMIQYVESDPRPEKRELVLVKS